MIPIYVGFDQREAVAYHAFCQSVIENTSEPVQLIPLARNALNGFDGQRDGSNAFIYSRFLVPYLNDYKGHAIYADGDMICQGDIAELWALRDSHKDVQVVKHDYKTKHQIKYLGAKNEDYEKKNWSSLILWNCGSFPNKILTPDVVSTLTGEYLHRFRWLQDDRIGELPKEWNWLATEYPDNEQAKLIHYTLGSCCFADYADAPMSRNWHSAFNRMASAEGESLLAMATRAARRA